LVFVILLKSSIGIGITYENKTTLWEQLTDKLQRKQQVSGRTRSTANIFKTTDQICVYSSLQKLYFMGNG